jgi:hypothetical protein
MRSRNPRNPKHRRRLERQRKAQDRVATSTFDGKANASREQERRIAQLRAKVQAMGGEAHWTSGTCPPDIEESFLRDIIAADAAPKTCFLIERLQRSGIELPPQTYLADDRLSIKLKELIRALADLDLYIWHTDHLSDRELYNELLTVKLRQTEPDSSLWKITGGPHFGFLDLIDRFSIEGMRLWLRYYADDEQRAASADTWDGPLPARRPTPFDRDRDLPKPPDGDEDTPWHIQIRRPEQPRS